MRKIYTAIDIGSDTFKIVVVEKVNNKLNVLASNIYPSLGIEKGVIVDENEVLATLKEALKKINNTLNLEIKKALINVPMDDANYKIVDGYTTITGEDNIVTSDDILNSLQASIYNKIPDDEELVTVMPIKYLLDDRTEVKNPRGLKANKLSTLVMMVTAPKATLYRNLALFDKAGIEVVDILFGNIGDYYTFKDDNYDKSTTAVINIGLNKTDIAIFNKGIITTSKVLPIGTVNIDEDISYVYNIPLDKARKIKEIFVNLDKKETSKEDYYETKDKSGIKISINQKEVSEIVYNNLLEIIKKAKKELNNLTKKEIHYIIITGGISNIPGFDTICSEVYNEVVSHRLNVIGIRDNMYSSSYGIVKYFINKLELRGREYSMFSDEEVTKIVSNWAKNEDTKVFSKFFSRLFDKED
ncbi:MAG: rod shape-determining protein [Bacilli bacterium]|nr:rod shape-determining protein [Bacilli bacterium]